jgi:hypothetical protein
MRALGASEDDRRERGNFRFRVHRDEFYIRLRRHRTRAIGVQQSRGRPQAYDQQPPAIGTCRPTVEEGFRRQAVIRETRSVTLGKRWVKSYLTHDPPLTPNPCWRTKGRGGRIAKPTVR